MSLISSIAHSSLRRISCSLSAIAGADTADRAQQRVDSAIGLPGSSFVVYIPLDSKASPRDPAKHARREGYWGGNWHMGKWRRHVREQDGK
ncbi:g5937 [Coccomyxa viridis]|uniref:G5937 protein n=1 Tax=Coccomyxa viridis TaxID=1274662 RepID=A0ABP1FZ09_9CHLO